MTNKFISLVDGKRIGIAPNLTLRLHRVDSVSILSRQSLLPILLLCLTLFVGVGNAWGATFTFNTDAALSALGISKPSSGAGTNLSTSSPYVVDGVSMSVGTCTSTATRVWNSSGTTSLRTYKASGKTGGSLTFSASSNITSIVFTGGSSFSASTGTLTNGTWTGNATSVTFTSTSGNTINSIAVTITSADPTITKSSSMTTLTCTNGSPVAQSFTVGGSNLTNNVIVTAPANGKYEVSTSQNSGYSNSVELSKGNGTLSNTTIYIRLKSALSGGNISADNISITSTGATTQTISVSGSVPYTITWMANGNSHATTYVTVGSTLALPASNPVPNSCGCTGKTFYGWYGGGTSYKNASVAPSIAAAGNIVNADKTYYAVFADAEVSSSGDATLTINSSSAGTTYNSTDRTIDGINMKATNNWSKQSNGGNNYVQIKTNGVVYNGTQLTGYIKSIAITKYGGTGNIYVGTSQNPTTNETTISSTTLNYTQSNNYTYFAIKSTSTLQLTSVVVTYSASTTTYSNYETSCCTPLGSINGSFSLNHFPRHVETDQICKP